MEEHELRKEKIQEDYNDKYWELRYTVVQRHIPSFLQKMAGKVLSTGERQPAAPWAPASRSSRGPPPRALGACVSTRQLGAPRCGPRVPGFPHSSQCPEPPWTPARGPPH